MTMHREKCCGHCGIRYYYQSSGHGCFDELNDDRYCPECKAVISAVLKKIPLKVEKVWVPVSEIFGDDITLDLLLAWEREREEEMRNSDKICARRMTFPLFDMSGKRTEHSGIVFGRDDKFKSYTFEYRYWTDNEESKNWYHECDEIREDIKISVEMERDIATGKLYPWKYFS